MSDKPEPRAEVVEDLCRAMREHDDELLAAAMPDATAAERAKAEELFRAWTKDDILSRQAEIWAILVPDRDAPQARAATWEVMLGDLPADAVARLGELYDDLPPGAQAEYDRRYGKPGSR